MDCLEKLRGIKRFIQNINGAFVDGSLSNLSTMMGRYENHRQRRTFEPDATLQLNAIHSGHPNVSNHTSRDGQGPRRQELFGGREYYR